MSRVQTTEADLLREIGRILHKAREDRGWTRQDLADVLGGDIAFQTLATYEQATRTLSVARLAELCRALRLSLPELIASACRATGPEQPLRGWRVDIQVLADAPDVAMVPLRNCARVRLMQPRSADTVLIKSDAVAALARSLGMPEQTLRVWLSRAARTGREIPCG